MNSPTPNDASQQRQQQQRQYVEQSAFISTAGVGSSSVVGGGVGGGGASRHHHHQQHYHQHPPPPLFSSAVVTTGPLAPGGGSGALNSPSSADNTNFGTQHAQQVFSQRTTTTLGAAVPSPPPPPPSSSGGGGSNTSAPNASSVHNSNANTMATTNNPTASSAYSSTITPQQQQFINSNFVAKDADRLLVEMMDQETSRYLSKDQLFDLARERGAQLFPLWISSNLFKYSLGVISVDKSHELSLLKAQEAEYKQLVRARKASGGGSGSMGGGGGGEHNTHVGAWKALRADPKLILNLARHYSRSQRIYQKQQQQEYNRNNNNVVNSGDVDNNDDDDDDDEWFISDDHSSSAARQRIENILDAIEITFPTVSRAMAKTIITYLGPMSIVNQERESDAYFCLRYFVDRLRSEGNLLHSSHSLLQIVSQFLCNFQTFNPALYKHFYENEIDLYDWLPSLLISLFVGHLPQQQLLVLWSYYLMDGLNFHPYVLLAILESCEEDLMEMDAEGILTFLRSKPFPMGSRGDSKALFARAKVLHSLATRKEKLV